MRSTDVQTLTDRDRADGVQQQVVGALIAHAGKILILRRKADDFLGGTWELPSGKVDPDEDLLAALHREVTEETGLTIARVTDYVGAFEYTSGSGRHSRQHTWIVTINQPGPVTLTEHDQYAWISESDQHPLSAEVRAIIGAHLANRPASVG